MQRLSGFICVFLPSKDDRQCAGISTGSLSHGIAQERNGVFKKKGISIALAIHSLDRSLQEINPKGWCAQAVISQYRTRYPLIPLIARYPLA